MQLRSVFVSFGLLLIAASSAQAAKGVKKNPNGEHHHHGKVVAVDHKTGTITIHTHHQSKKKAGAANNAGAAQVHKFTFNTNTKVVSKQGKQMQPSSVKALHIGEFISVAAHQHHADGIMIHHRAKGQKKGAKKNVN